MARRDRNRRGRPRDDDWETGRERRSDRRTDRRQRDHRRDLPAARQEQPPTMALVPAQPAVPVARVCGNCQEWFAHDAGGRGDCSHPGSGFSFPWADTPACDFFDARR
jgi:hypothetical protein